jgi:membrane protein YdbS with pleckstrin-like domain
MTIHWPMLKRMMWGRREPMTPFRWAVVVIILTALLVYEAANSPDARAVADTVIRVGGFVVFIWLFSRRRAIWRYWREGK